MANEPLRIAVLTISDGVHRGTRSDASGECIVRWIAQHGWTLAAREVTADDRDVITARLCAWADAGAADVVLTTGGTGLTARDVSPEATRAALEREAPGFAEALRVRGAEATPMAWLSRGVAGTRARTLIINLPGSERAVAEGLAVLEPLLPHAVQLLRGHDTEQHPA